MSAVTDWHRAHGFDHPPKPHEITVAESLELMALTPEPGVIKIDVLDDKIRRPWDPLTRWERLYVWLARKLWDQLPKRPIR